MASNRGRPVRNRTQSDQESSLSLGSRVSRSSQHSVLSSVLLPDWTIPDVRESAIRVQQKVVTLWSDVIVGNKFNLEVKKKKLTYST